MLAIKAEDLEDESIKDEIEEAEREFTRVKEDFSPVDDNTRLWKGRSNCEGSELKISPLLEMHFGRGLKNLTRATRRPYVFTGRFLLARNSGVSLLSFSETFRNSELTSCQ